MTKGLRTWNLICLYTSAITVVMSMVSGDPQYLIGPVMVLCGVTITIIATTGGKS